MSMSIGHRESAAVVIDKVVEKRPPFSPMNVVEEFARVLKAYRVKTVNGDRYAGEWPVEAFRRHGITYEPAGKAKSDLYVAFLPLLSSVTVELVDHPRLISQIVGLERRTSRSGKDSIDHSPGGHDDVANGSRYSITLSARARNNSGIATPRALAALRFIHRSNFVGRDGRSRTPVRCVRL